MDTVSCRKSLLIARLYAIISPSRQATPVCCIQFLAHLMAFLFDSRLYIYICSELVQVDLMDVFPNAAKTRSTLVG